MIGEVALKTTKEAKFRGFGAAKMLGGSEKVVTFRVICGVGIGKAHVWSMDIDSSCNTVVKVGNVLLHDVIGEDVWIRLIKGFRRSMKAGVLRSFQLLVRLRFVAKLQERW